MIEKVVPPRSRSIAAKNSFPFPQSRWPLVHPLKKIRHQNIGRIVRRQNPDYRPLDPEILASSLSKNAAMNFGWKFFDAFSSASTNFFWITDGEAAHFRHKAFVRVAR